MNKSSIYGFHGELTFQIYKFTERPDKNNLMAGTFIKGKWQNLIMANYEVDKKVLLKFLPYKTELDEWNNTYYASLVGFMFLNTKVKGMYIPFHRNFEEVNLRFYVRYKENDQWKRGVVFIKEIVPRAAICFVANNLYGEKYISLPMKHLWECTDENMQKIEYYWKISKNWNHLKVIAEATGAPLKKGSEEEFITEHFWGYTKIKNNISSEYEVAHPRWNIYKINSFDINCSTKELYGEEFVSYLQEKPKSIFLADGSSIEIKSGAKI